MELAIAVFVVLIVLCWISWKIIWLIPWWVWVLIIIVVYIAAAGNHG